MKESIFQVVLANVHGETEDWGEEKGGSLR